MQTYNSNGKLLLTGEYVVLDGAMALALPTKLGQSLTVETIEDTHILWKSIDGNGKIWFEDCFEINNEAISRSARNNSSVSGRLAQILKVANTLNPNFISGSKGYKVTTKLSFPKDWGLGTSSTLINNIAQWANINPYKLLELTFGGSGYDIACAKHNTPITYQITNSKPKAQEVNFNPSFKDYLYFVYLNKKQDSQEGIAHYKNSQPVSKTIIDDISQITQSMIHCKAFNDFKYLMQQHESKIANITQQIPVKERLFNDFSGSVKSLGAWGGDFILVASKDNPKAYFESKGYTTILNYANLIK